MARPLQLTLTDYQSESRWRWVLKNARGNLLADHEVSLDTSAPEYSGFFDLPAYLHRFAPIRPEAQTLFEIGAWMGEHVFGGLLSAFKDHGSHPATIVHVIVEPDAQALLFRPFELAHIDGKPLAESGVRFVYRLADSPAPKAAKPISETLRVLAIFSLPDDASPLNLRRERYRLKRLLLDELTAQGAAIHLRIIQYGATRDILKAALHDADGWDIIHFSGHGREGELLLEDAAGKRDLITAADLTALLLPARDTVKLLTLSACLSGAATLQEARIQIGLDHAPLRDSSSAATTANDQPSPEPSPEAIVTLQLPSLGQKLSAALDCAVLAMRYPVGDRFATDLIDGVYGLMLGADTGQALPGALQVTLKEILRDGGRHAALPLSLVTPILFGPRAADLKLKPPKRKWDEEEFHLDLSGYFPDEPEHFVGRLIPMLHASGALAPNSPHRGVIFHGMAGAGKTYCALELAYRHERGRFLASIWHKAPDIDADITTAFSAFLIAIETQLNYHDLALTAHADEPEKLKTITLPRLKAFLQQNAILIVLDNIESLLTSTGGWRDEKWGHLINALLGHNGSSRLVLTSRRVPTSLENHPKLLRESIHALSFSESVLLARELPNLSPLFASQSGLKLLTRTLKVAQGHPKLLDLADRSAPDPRALTQYLSSSERAADPDAALESFFSTDRSSQDERAFTATLHAWTAGLTANLPGTARLLFQFLCRLEEDDGIYGNFAQVWPNFLNRLAETVPAAAAARLEPGLGLDSALDRLTAVGLVEKRRPHTSSELSEEAAASRTLYRIHPAVAEAGRNGARQAVLDAADIELGDFWYAMFRQGLETVMQGGGAKVVHAGLHGAPYLMRAERWDEIGPLLAKVSQFDHSPTTLATVLPLQRHLAESTKILDSNTADLASLARMLLNAGRYQESEQILREVIARCEQQQDYRRALASAGTLADLLRENGRNQEALSVAEQTADLTRRGGFGPWTQLATEGMRLQILNQIGWYEEVLDAVQRLRAHMTSLPERSETEEAVSPWNAQEALLNTGSRAAVNLQEWEIVLSLNADIVEAMRQRGADPFAIARTRYNDYSPLLRLHRLCEARALLEYCRTEFDLAYSVEMLGKVYCGLADLEDEEGNSTSAVEFERVALRYKYQAGQPEGCAISHNNLANYLKNTKADADAVLAYRLAGGIIWFQTGSGNLRATLNGLAAMALPDAPPAFNEVAEIVEQVEGVRFAEMFARLPLREPDGDAAIREIWRMVKEG